MRHTLQNFWAEGEIQTQLEAAPGALRAPCEILVIQYVFRMTLILIYPNRIQQTEVCFDIHSLQGPGISHNLPSAMPRPLLSEPHAPPNRAEMCL